MSDVSEDDAAQIEKTGGITLIRINPTRSELRLPPNRPVMCPRAPSKTAKSVSFDHSLTSSFIPIRVAKVSSERDHRPHQTKRLFYPSFHSAGQILSHNAEGAPKPENVWDPENNLQDFSNWSDSSLEFDNNSSTYGTTNVNKLPRKGTPNSANPTVPIPYLHKTYKIGKNTNLNITVGRPSLLKNMDKPKPVQKKQETGCNKTGKKGLPSLQKGKIKAIISRRKERLSKEELSLPFALSEEAERVLTEDDSEESFRTFVLDTSTRPGYNTAQGKRPRHQLRKKDLFGSGGTQPLRENSLDDDPSTKEVEPFTAGLHPRMLPFKFLLSGKGVGGADASAPAAGLCPKEEAPRTLSRMKASFDSLFHSGEGKDGGRAPRGAQPRLLSGLRRSLGKVSSLGGAAAPPPPSRPRKGILKKAGSPRGGSLPRVTYDLAPSPPDTDEGESQTSNLTESDSGLEFDLDGPRAPPDSVSGPAAPPVSATDPDLPSHTNHPFQSN